MKATEIVTWEDGDASLSREETAEAERNTLTLTPPEFWELLLDDNPAASFRNDDQ